MENVELSYDFLRSVLLQERSQNSLETVGEDFFDKFDGFVRMQDQVLQQNFSLEQARVVDNSRKMLGELRKTRLRKILFKALRDFESNAINSTGLATGEKEFYRSVILLLGENLRKAEESSVRVRMLVDMPKIQTPEAGIIGPFAKGELVSVDVQTAQLLLEKHAAEKSA